MARYMMQISTRSCCGRHRWPLVDIVESLAASGLEHIVLEEIAFAGERVSLALPLEASSNSSIVSPRLWGAMPCASQAI